MPTSGPRPTSFANAGVPQPTSAGPACTAAPASQRADVPGFGAVRSPARRAARIPPGAGARGKGGADRTIERGDRDVRRCRLEGPCQAFADLVLGRGDHDDGAGWPNHQAAVRAGNGPRQGQDLAVQFGRTAELGTHPSRHRERAVNLGRCHGVVPRQLSRDLGLDARSRQGVATLDRCERAPCEGGHSSQDAQQGAVMRWGALGEPL